MIVPIRIGFDLDGVLADMDAAMSAVAERLFGAEATSLSSSDLDPESAPAETAPESTAAGTRSQNLSRGRDIWREVRKIENFWETLSEIEAGAVARLAALADEYRWEVVFITQRPSTAGDTTQRQSQRWLANLGFVHPSVCVVDASRGKVADALGLDVVVDDRPENCLDVATDSKAKAVLIWRGDQQHVVPNARRLGVEVAGSVGACLDQLAAGQWLPKARGGGIVGRVRRWLDSSRSIQNS